MPRVRLSDEEKKRRRREQDRKRKQNKRARLRTPPSQEELDERRERRLQQRRDDTNRRRARQEDQENQLIVGNVARAVPDTNAILQQMSEEIDADRRRLVDAANAETDTAAPPARMPLAPLGASFTTPVNPLALMPHAPAVPTYGTRSFMRREMNREGIEQQREGNRVRRQRFRERRRTENEELTPSVDDILTSIGKGEKKANEFVALHEHPDIKLAHRDFHRKLDEYKTCNFFHCQYCKERGPHTRESKYFRGECTRCQESRNRRSGGEIRKYSAQNDMDPFPNGYPHHLPKLRPIEEALIARSHIVMKCYRIQGNGRVMYKGNVVNLQKETNLLNALPAAFDELPICFIVRVDHPNAPTHRDFQCRREAVRQWLIYLKQNHPMYRDLQIYWNRVDELPEDGNV